MCKRPRSSTCIATLKPSPPAPSSNAPARGILEHDVADMRALLAHLLFGLADRDAFQIRRHDERGDAARAFALRIAARHQREHAGAIGVGDEALGAVDDIVVAIADGGGAHRGASEPAPGSVSAKLAMTSPLASFGSHSFFCVACRTSRRPGCRCRHWCR
jgi:hypothetical protein